MVDFLKTMGQGILYTLLAPFLLVIVIVYAIYCFFVFFFMFVKRIVMFFQGEDMSREMKIDRAARMHLNNQDELMEKKQEEMNNPTITQTNIIKEEKTTIIQPLIIQTDEQGNVKKVQYISPTPTTMPNIENQIPQIEENKVIENEEEKEGDQ